MGLGYLTAEAGKKQPMDVIMSPEGFLC
jgi:hypothetical protein